MKYKNTRTGAVIETSGKVSGGDWVKIIPVAPAQPEVKEKTTARTAAKKPTTKKTTRGKQVES